MFDNIGGKIKTLAKVICWIGIIAFVITGISMMIADDDMIIYGIIMMPVGALMSWIGSFMLYGFGELVENSSILAQAARNNQKPL